MSICFTSPSHAQIIDTQCETTQIFQPGVGWIEGSEITTCTSTVTTINDGSGALENMNNSCGLGNPCPSAPEDEGGTLTDEQVCQAQQAVESHEDSLAANIAKEIRKENTPTSNPDNNEFGAFVLRLSNNQYVRVSLTEGITGAVSLTGMLRAARTQYGQHINAANIVAVVHSHPREAGPGFENVSNIGELSDLDYGNTMPSHPNIQPGANDWGNTRSFLLNNGRTNVADVAHYILGPDGVLRQYNYSDGHPAESSEQYQSINDAETNANGECNESNN